MYNGFRNARIGWWFLLIASILLLLQRSKRQRLIVIGHRGAAGLAPENTLASLQVAQRLGATWVEVDVQRTRDNVLVILHDNDLDRTTNGTGKVLEMDSEYVATLDAGSWYGSKFAGEPIPRLDEVLVFIREHKLTLCLEAKDPALYPGIGEQLATAIREHQLVSQVVVISFDREWLRGFSEFAPDITVGSLWETPHDANSVPTAQYIDVYWLTALLNPTLIWQAHQDGRKLIVWTVNSPIIAWLLVLLGVDAITTDRPDLMLPLAGS